MAPDSQKTKEKMKIKFNFYFVLLIFLFLLLVASIFTSGFGLKNLLFPKSKDEIAKKTVDFINKNLISGQEKASLVSVNLEDNGLYKIKIKVGEQEFESYISSDGKFLFPQAISLEEKPPVAETQEEEKLTCDDIKKTEKPLLEAFVVSKCPFGLQMQRILNEVVKNISSLASNIKVEYMGSVENGKITAMHGDEEAQENLRQICVREEQSGKYWGYIACHIKKGDVDNCLLGAKVDKGKLENCMSDKSKGLEYAKKDFNLQNKYKVGGSPTLILNGVEINEGAFASGMNLTMRSAELVKTLLCCAFKGEPQTCSQKLSKDAAATGFSEIYSSSSSSSGSGGCPSP